MSAHRTYRDHSEDGRTIEYRGLTLTKAWGGHWNVSKGDGFCGGFKTIAEAKRWIDSRFVKVTRVGPNTYRVEEIPA